MIEIDGTYGEGGGQILRTALALSCLLQKPFRIFGIRARRSIPGLRPQHLAGVKAAQAITRATVSGAAIGSTALIFEPFTIKGGKYHFDVAEERGSAGSVSLVLQTILLPLVFAKEPSTVTIRGGTHVPWSPPFHYLDQVFFPALKDMGIAVRATLERWGWYPLGEGITHFSLSPVNKLGGIAKDKKIQIEKVTAISALSNLPDHVMDRQRKQLLARLSAIGTEATCETIRGPSIGQGTFVFLKVQERHSSAGAGFSALGAKGKPAEEVADEAADLFFSFLKSQAAVDRHLADQLVPYLALASGKSRILTSEVTPHLLTNVWVVQHFTQAKIQVEGVPGRPGMLTCVPVAR